MDSNSTLTFNVPADPPATAGTGTSGTSTSGTGTSGTTTSGTTTSSGSNALTLQVSGDQYNGDPQIEVFVDGQQIGGTYTVTADHSSGQTQTITIAGNFNPTVAHQVQVEFVNDAWDGTPWWSEGISPDGHDRNVYVESISLNGETLNGSQGTDPAPALPPSNANEAVMDSNSTLTFNVPADAPATAGTGTSGTSTSSTGTSGSSTTTSGSSTTTSDSSGTSASGSTTSTGTIGTGASDPAQTTDAFYVSPTGSDSNAGTLAAPFATLARAQEAMEGGSIKTTYVEGGTYNITSTLTLTAADNGETWQYYAPDGVNSAVIDGGNSVSVGIVANGVSDLTIDGLTVQHFQTFGIAVQNGSNACVVENCNVGYTTDASGATTAGILVSDATNSTIANNYVHDTSGQGISVFAYTAGTSVNGDVVTGNVVLRAGQADSDIGAIYTNMDGTGLNGGHVTISNNFVEDTGAASLNNDMVGIYLDDNSSNVTVTGNVVGPPAAGAVNSGNANFTSAFVVHNGADDTISGNIVDLGSSGMVAIVNWAQDSGNLGQGMSGDTFTNNIVIASFTGSQQAEESGIVGYSYFASLDYTSPTQNPQWFTIADNLYFNDAGGQLSTSGFGISGDTNPVLANPQISGATYTIASGSPAFSSPVNFAPIIGGWGPPGFVISQSASSSV